MKAACHALLAALMLQTASVVAESTTASIVAGHWELDVSKLPMAPEDRPKGVTLDFRDAGGGKWSSRVEIVDQHGGTMHSESTLSLDGTPGMSTGNYWVDVCAAKMPAPNVLVMQFAYKGDPVSTRIYTVAAGGATLTETEAFFKKDGTPALRTAVFNRKAL
jgi:hypothetical protein